MSYCGTCGTFYSPECPYRRDGGCIPAVNPFEKQLIDAQARLTAIQIGAKAVELSSEGKVDEARVLYDFINRINHIHD